ncbi:MAG: hypothetical protein ACLT40_03600 [Fusobacterium sp.]
MKVIKTWSSGFDLFIKIKTDVYHWYIYDKETRIFQEIKYIDFKDFNFEKINSFIGYNHQYYKKLIENIRLEEEYLENYLDACYSREFF